MPRPTTAQLAYGSATVVFSTFALLLLTDTRTAMGITAVAIAGLGLIVQGWMNRRGNVRTLVIGPPPRPFYLDAASSCGQVPRLDARDERVSVPHR